MFASRSWRFLLLSCLLGFSSWMIEPSDASMDTIAVSPARVLDESKAPADKKTELTDEKADKGGPGNEEGGTDDGGGKDPCSAATTCAECETASKSLEDKNEVCSFSLVPTEELGCAKKPKEAVENELGDMCSTEGGIRNGSDGSALIYPDEEEGNGILLAIILLLVFAGIVYSNRDKMLKILRAADGFDGIGGGETSASASKPVKYHDLSGVDEDEEWGWGEDKDSSGGDIELPGSDSTGSIGSYKDEVVHKRNTSVEIRDPASFGSRSASPLSTRAVAPAPGSGGLNVSSSATNSRNSGSGSATPVKSGISLMSKQQKPKPNKPPTSAPVMPTPAVTQPMPTSAATSIPQRITSLGKKKPVAPAKPKPTTKSPEDDIFASMGLSAKPKFSAPPAPAATSSSGGSRWAMAATTAVASDAVNTSSTLSANFSDEGGGDDDWEDDDDLNDLLDD